MSVSLGEFEQLVLLAVLRLGDSAYGVQIRRAIEDKTGRDVAAGAIYTTLSRLEKRGFVSSRPGETIPERTGQRRRYYAVQPEGAAALYRSYSDVRRMAHGVLGDLESLAREAGEGLSP